MEELGELIDSPEPDEFGVFENSEALVRYAEGRVKTQKMEPPAEPPDSIVDELAGLADQPNQPVVAR